MDDYLVENFHKDILGIGTQHKNILTPFNTIPNI